MEEWDEKCARWGIKLQDGSGGKQKKLSVRSKNVKKVASVTNSNTDFLQCTLGKLYTNTMQVGGSIVTCGSMAFGGQVVCVFDAKNDSSLTPAMAKVLLEGHVEYGQIPKRPLPGMVFAVQFEDDHHTLCSDFTENGVAEGLVSWNTKWAPAGPKIRCDGAIVMRAETMAFKTGKILRRRRYYLHSDSQGLRQLVVYSGDTTDQDYGTISKQAAPARANSTLQSAIQKTTPAAGLANLWGPDVMGIQLSKSPQSSCMFTHAQATASKKRPFVSLSLLVCHIYLFLISSSPPLSC